VSDYVRFDLNDYSIPHDKVRHLLSVLAEPHELRILDGAQIIARHRRSYNKGAQVEDTAHIEALLTYKRAARRQRNTDRLARAVPQSQTLMVQAAERRARRTRSVNADEASYMTGSELVVDGGFVAVQPACSPDGLWEGTRGVWRR
jgi:Mu transposase, C-terminal domain